MDAGFNFMAVEHMIRDYSYTSLAMMRCLHDNRYFWGVAFSAQTQKTLIMDYFNQCFWKNMQRVREGKHPVMFEDCHGVARKILASNKIMSFSNFYNGDLYIGSNEVNLKRNNQRIA